MTFSRFVPIFARQVQNGEINRANVMLFRRVKGWNQSKFNCNAKLVSSRKKPLVTTFSKQSRHRCQNKHHELRVFSSKHCICLENLTWIEIIQAFRQWLVAIYVLWSVHQRSFFCLLTIEKYLIAKCVAALFDYCSITWSS